MQSKTTLAAVTTLGLTCASLGGCETRSGSAATPPTSVVSATNVRTQMATVGDRQFAYRSVGTGSPVLFLQRFRGNHGRLGPRVG